ncbi:hypothetical protein C8N46_10891 [Kordia periserrulae]|uniref:Uncharacterized protein n=1 Tax=Kordia periserrulae TaxID=701523 RepID=A0A2T6BUM4_9FLAO|nr:hypothetical protein [Kordia periserrulae]PTX59781.1 hypothetical protein C8N46_10891 [Kordia periserrulae]
MFHKNPEIGQELLNVPMGQMIESMATSIANAQMALDSNSIEVAEMMGGLSPVKSTINGREFINFKDSRVFFGKEKVQTSDAVELYNSNSDAAYRAAIIAKIDPADIEDGYDKPVVNVDKNPVGANDAVFTPDNPKNADVYYRHGGDWYEYNAGTEVYASITAPTVVPGKKMKKPEKAEKTLYLPQRLSMLELGFSPTFYQFVDTIIKVSISIKFTREGSSSYQYQRNSKSTDRSASFSWRRGLKTNKTVTTTQVNAGFSQKYSYSAEGSSLLQTKLVPIPPPAALEERVQQQMALAREEAEN